jgi:glycosyltransferase involved in cell wall biosynthesis
MRVLFLHQAFPAQFGRLALDLTRRYGWECRFLVEAVADCPTPSPEMLQTLRVDAVAPPAGWRDNPNPSWRESYHYSLTWCRAVYDAVKARRDWRPDLVVAYAPAGTPALFLPEAVDCPIVQYCEYYYGERRDVSYRIDLPPVAMAPFLPRCVNAINLVNLAAGFPGYAPTRWQRQTFPERWRHNIEVHFDGIDTEEYKPRRPAVRELAGRSFPADTRVVTFVSRGLESMRGFDIFMGVARRLMRERSDVFFIVVGNDKCYYGRDALHTGRVSFKQGYWSRASSTRRGSCSSAISCRRRWPRS